MAAMAPQNRKSIWVRGFALFLRTVTITLPSSIFEILESNEGLQVKIHTFVWKRKLFHPIKSKIKLTNKHIVDRLVFCNDCYWSNFWDKLQSVFNGYRLSELAVNFEIRKHYFTIKQFLRKNTLISIICEVVTSRFLFIYFVCQFNLLSTFIDFFFIKVHYWYLFR